jgi:hypothetical protein
MGQVTKLESGPMLVSGGTAHQGQVQQTSMHRERERERERETKLSPAIVWDGYGAEVKAAA